VPVPGTGGADSHDRLFGETNRNFVTSKNNLKSSIPIGDVADGGAKLTNGKANGHSNGTTNGHANGNGHTNGKGTSENGHTNGNGYASSEAASVRKGELNLIVLIFLCFRCK
jgi:Microtubule-Associated protein Jupiter